MTSRLCSLAAAFLLAANVLIRFDSMEIVVYVDPEVSVESPLEFTARQACGLLKSMHLALPVPYRIEWRKPAANGAMASDAARVLTGLLTSCEESSRSLPSENHAPVASP